MPTYAAYATTELWIDATIVVGAWILGWIAARFVFGMLAKLSERSNTELDDLLVQVIRRALPWLAFSAALVATVRIGPTRPDFIWWADRIAMATVVLAATMALARFLSGMLERRVLPVGGVAGTTLARKLVRLIVIITGVLVLMSNLGFEITPFLTALGVGSLALGLALQPTLTNLFAGFNLAIGQRLRVGDVIRLESGEEGTIADIGWRSTEIREMSDNLVLIPNSKLADMVVRNYSLPRGAFSVSVRLGVSYDSDLDRVEKIAAEVAREVQKNVTGAVSDYEPAVRFLRFGESSIELVVTARIESYVDQRAVEHELIKRLHARFRREGIQIPYPQRVVRLEDARERAEAPKL
jgi:small-conductance mechanosensitive channel